jgi:hypothetical protein
LLLARGWSPSSPVFVCFFERLIFCVCHCMQVCQNGCSRTNIGKIIIHIHCR